MQIQIQESSYRAEDVQGFHPNMSWRQIATNSNIRGINTSFFEYSDDEKRQIIYKPLNLIVRQALVHPIANKRRQA